MSGTAAAQAAATTSLIRVEGLTKVFGTVTRALDSVSLEVPRGQFLCVIGPSGSGKSTLLRCLNRLVEPTAGHVWVHDEEITAQSGEALRRSRRRLVPGFSTADRDLAWSSLARLDIAEKATIRADQLSGGQMQRVALARALAQQPELLLADEPVASLDPETAVVVLDYLRDINRSDGITVLCAMHHLDLAKKYADRIVAMRQGRVVYDGLPGDLDDAAYRRIYGRLGYD